MNKLKEIQIRRRVKKGARLLDEHMPGWVEKIIPGRLDLASTSYCILGQTFSSFTKGMTVLGVEKSTEKYGFDLEASDPDDGWEILDKAWIKEIKKRKRSS